MTKNTTPDLMRVALNKNYSLVHNYSIKDESIVILYCRIIRILLLEDENKLIHFYKHIFPTLKYMNQKKYSRESSFQLEEGKKVVLAAIKAETYFVDIKCFSDNLEINVLTKKPNLLLGKEGKTLNSLLLFMSSLTGFLKDNIKVSIKESNEPSPTLIAKRMAANLVRRMSCKKVIDTAKLHIKEYTTISGYHITLSGKLNGSAIARSEKTSFGSIPKSTLGAKVLSCNENAYTVYGVIGVKVVICISNIDRKNKPKDEENNKFGKKNNRGFNSKFGSKNNTNVKQVEKSW